MRWIITLLTLLAVGIGFALFAEQDPGFIVIGRGDWTASTSLTAFISLLVLSFVFLYVLLRLFFALWRFPKYIRQQYHQRLHGHTFSALQQGIDALLEARWGQAERILLRKQPQSLHFLAAAYAAHRQGHWDKREQHMQKAYHFALPESQIALGLQHATLQLESQQYSLALSRLQILHQTTPKHPRILALLMTTQQTLHHWTALMNLLPEIRRYKAIDKDTLSNIEQQVGVGVLQQISEQDITSIQSTWQGLPQSMQQNRQVIRTYLSYLLKAKLNAEAETLLHQHLNRHWDAELSWDFAQIDVNPIEQLKCAEEWLKLHSNDATLLRALGILSMRNQLWGKARQYLDNSLNQAKHVLTYQALGDLQIQLNNSEQAIIFYRLGLDTQNAG